MKTKRIMAVTALIVGSTLALHVASAQQPGVRRTELQRHDLGAPGREIVQVRIDEVLFSRPERSTRRKTSEAATGRSSRRISSKKGSRSS